jgi:hypothetical protein
MRRYARFAALLAVFAVLAAATPLSTPPDISGAVPIATATSVYRVQLGDLLTMNGKFDLARREYAVAVNLARAEGYLPVEELRRIANTYYFEKNYTNAIAVLEGLAREAGSLGEEETQVWAMADATWLAGLSDEEGQMDIYLERLEDLLDTYELPGARYKIRTGLMKNFTVFAPHLPSW